MVMRQMKQLHSLIINVSCRRDCEAESLDPLKVRGKIVICRRGGNGGVDVRLAMGRTVKEAGGVGMILVNEAIHGEQVESDPHVLPASHISYKDGLTLIQYLNKTVYVKFLASSNSF